MKPSEKLINKLMEQYLDDLRNYGDDKELILCENLFNKTKQLLNESTNKTNGFKLLMENVSSRDERVLVKDFKMYCKLILEN